MSAASPSTELVRVLAEHRERFLRFAERRTGSRDAAEEVLHAALVKGLERGDSLRDGESAVAWFYRLLRNVLIDHARRRATGDRVLERFALEHPLASQPESKDATCACVAPLVDGLHPAYAKILRQVEVEGASVAEVAQADAITANNATVRLHRARKALRQKVEQTCGICAAKGCTDCSC